MDRSGLLAAPAPDKHTGDGAVWAETFRERSLEIRADLADREIRVRVRTSAGIAVRRMWPDRDHFDTATTAPDGEADAGPAVLAAHHALRGVRDGGGTRAVVRLRTRDYHVSNSDGVDSAASGSHIHLVVETAPGGAVLALTDLADLTEAAGFDAGTRAAEQARRLDRSAVRPESTRCAAVFSPTAAGVLVHEMVGHSLEADAIGAALWAARGNRFGPASLSIWDDGRSSREGRAAAWETVAADEEGTPLTSTPLVTAGIVVGRVTDRAAARRLGLPHSSGHGRRGGYAHRPAARVRHTVVGDGTDSADSLIGATGDGVLIESVDSGEASVRDGRFTLRIREGRRIRGGRLAETLTGFSVTGTLADFGRLDGLGSDGTGHRLLCGRGTHWLAVSGVAPTIRLPLVDVIGAA